MYELIVFPVVGVVASLVGSMSGLGGGFLAIPILYYIGVVPEYVVSSAKFMVFVNSAMSTYRYLREIKFSPHLYGSVVLPMIVTAYIGAYLVAILPRSILLLLIGIILLIGSLRMLVSKQREAGGKASGATGREKILVGFLSGSLSGFIAGISGLGGGVVNMPIFLYILGLDPHIAVSMSMAAILPSALSSVVRHVIDGIVRWEIAVPLGIGACIGGFIGPRLALRVEKERLRKLIGIVMLIATTRIIVDAVLTLF